jgi:hypothetical protein
VAAPGGESAVRRSAEGVVSATIHIGDARTVLATLPEKSAQTCVTSPPYFGLRSYLDADHEQKSLEVGAEATVDEYVSALVDVFREVRRVLKDDGTVWLNLGDSYAGSWGNQDRKEERGAQRPINGGMIQNLAANYPNATSNTGTIRDPSLKPKDLIGIPWRVAFALQADGWYLRSEII